MRHTTTTSRACFLLLLLAVTLLAQPYPIRGTMTNQDVVTLAKAGFEEDLLIEIVHSSQKRFDTSVEGLAGLAQQGISQRLIKAMMTAAEPVATAAPVAGAATVHSSSSNLSPELREYIVAVSPINMAVSGNVPYYESRSSFWGLRRKEIEVGGAHRPGARIGVQTPASYFFAQYPRYSLPVSGPHLVQQPQLSPVLSHYVLPR